MRGGPRLACPLIIHDSIIEIECRMQDHKYKVKIEYGVAAIVAFIGIFFIFQALTIKISNEAVGPRTMPMALAISLVLGAIWLWLRAYRGKVGAVQSGYGFIDSDTKRITLVIGCGVLFVTTFWLFGFFMSVITGYVAALLSFGVRSGPKIIISTIVMAVMLQWLFMGIMRLNDPKGELIDMRPLTDFISGN